MTFSTAWNPSPVSAPKISPSSGPLISFGAASTIMITPHSLKTSSFSGAESESDQFCANLTPAVLAHSDSRPWLAMSAHPAAAVPPQITAATDQTNSGDRAGRSRRSSQNPITSSGTSRITASRTGPGKTCR